MAKAKNLARFSIEASKGGFQIHLEDDGGETLELFATEEQIDIMVDALDEALGDDVGDDIEEEEGDGARSG